MGPLYGIGEGDATPVANLCSTCKEINVPNLVRELDALPDWLQNNYSQSRPRGMPHLSDARQLPISAAEGCSMCQLILSAVLKWDQSESAACQNAHVDRLSSRSVQRHDSTWFPAHKGDVELFKEDLVNRPIYLRPSTPSEGTPVFPGDDVAGACHLYGFKALVPVTYGVLGCQIILYASQDSAAALSCDIIARQALPSSNSPEAFSLINRWMSTCIFEHDVCKKLLCGAGIDDSTPPALPTRIIHVAALNGALCPRLIETNGEIGHYVTLSSCWKGGVQGTTTDIANSDLDSGLPWDRISRVYQDAMTITYRLGLEYIWINSFCNDQSTCKGAVFENARLTIAASHATDAGQTLFSQRPLDSPPIELRHVTQSGTNAGSVFAIAKRQDNQIILPEFSPLASHAWATEELLFSRRTIFFTPNAVTWSCKRISQRETGVHFHTTTRNPQWRVVVEKHSARSVNKPSDRLGTLESLRVQLGETRPHDEYRLGLWKEQMPVHLLWYCLYPAARSKCTLSLPTWTWASTMCSVLFGGRFGDPRSIAKSACKEIRFDKASKTLSFLGTVKRVPKLALFAHTAECKDVTWEEMFASLESLHGSPPVDQKRYILADNGSVLGWAFVDESDTPSIGLRCIQLMSQKISAKKRGARKPLYHEWVLLLPGAEDEIGRFHRIGMGVITTDEPWFEDQARTQIFLG